METATIKTKNCKIALDIRTEPRITLPVTLFLRRTTNSSWYRRQVETVNVSRRGASILSEIPLQPGSEIQVFAFNDQFSALATVKHVERRWDDRWMIGIEFTEKCGRWVVI